MGDKLGDATGFESAVGAVRANLRPGGPPVDYAALDLHVAGELDDETSQRVREHIVTWESWNRAFWETQEALADQAKVIPEASASVTAKSIETETVHGVIDRRVRPFTEGERAMSECDVVQIARSVELDLFPDGCAQDARRRFYEAAVDYIDELLTAYARKFESAEDGATQTSSGPSDTVSSGTLETTFVTTSSDAKRFLGRQTELARLCEVFPEAARYYSLGRFVSEKEIASWYNVDTIDVKKSSKFIRAKLAVAESRL